MHVVSNTVTNIIAHNTITMLFCQTLCSKSNIAQMISRESLFNSIMKTVARNFAQRFCLVAYCTYIKCPSVVTNPTINSGACVNGDDVTFFKYRARRRNAVNNLIVNRRTKRSRISVVTLKRRNSAMQTNKVFYCAVNFFGSNTRFYQRSCKAQSFFGKLSCTLHLFNFLRTFNMDHKARSSLTRVNTSSGSAAPSTSLSLD